MNELALSIHTGAGSRWSSLVYDHLTLSLHSLRSPPETFSIPHTLAGTALCGAVRCPAASEAILAVPVLNV
jgi:hypothetical protein